MLHTWNQYNIEKKKINNILKYVLYKYNRIKVQRM